MKNYEGLEKVAILNILTLFNLKLNGIGCNNNNEHVTGFKNFFLFRTGAQF